MTYENALEKIHSLLTFGSRPGLDRIKTLLDLMGNPQDNLKFIHVAGTNGKGSVCQMLSAVLTNQGYKTGLFISPYITDFRERIQINGKMISENELTKAVEETFPLVENLRKKDCIITEFEYVMALEFYIHNKAKCDIVVLETGMGGLLDCTNVIKPPLCSVITAIGLDHTEILGSTIEEITLQKCGIIKPDSFVVTSIQEEKTMKVIEDTAREKEVPLYKSEDFNIQVVSSDIEKTILKYNNLELTLYLTGLHQIENAKTALTVLENLRCKRILKIDDTSLVKGFKKAVNPARLEIISKNPLILLDGAHNPNGIEALKKSLDFYIKGKKKICILGMLRDKDSLSSIKLLENTFDEVVTVPINNPRALNEIELYSKCLGHFKKVTPKKDIFSAFDYAYNKAKEKNLALVICGSLYLSGEIRPYALEKAK
ncbi:MAG: bifunctional folylpolyglutamate synthase/dihydrofolate synthase [Ruminococcus sp.]|nr:bifunctional folylpolyglutamate synthase/dihydrofolate synthase [Ruminococcus sp.]